MKKKTVKTCVSQNPQHNFNREVMTYNFTWNVFLTLHESTSVGENSTEMVSNPVDSVTMVVCPVSSIQVSISGIPFTLIVGSPSE